MQQAIRREMPTLSSRLKVKKLMRQEELIRNILHTRRLGADLASPRKKEGERGWRRSTRARGRIPVQDSELEEEGARTSS